MPAFERKSRAWADQHERNIEKKEDKLKTLQALLSTYERMGWGNPNHKCYSQVTDLNARIAETQTQLHNMGGSKVGLTAAELREKLGGLW